MDPISYVDPPPSLQVAFRMDIRTRGAQEGLMISTGVLAGSSGANYSAGAQNGCWPTWPTLALDANNAMRNEIITPQPSLEDNAKDQNAIRADSSTPKEWLQLQPQLQLQSKPELPKQHESAWTNNPNNNDLKELEGAQLRHSSNIEGRHFFDNNNRNSESNLKPTGNPNSGRSLGAAAFQHFSNDPTIRLNLFEGSEEPLVPLQAPPGVRGSGDGGLLTQFELGAGFPPATTSAAATTPLLCDSTTTTTTLEVFRPRADSADFFQLPRGPLSHSKEPVLIVPAKGAEFERREKSETRFSDTIRRMEFASQIPHQQKSVQWGDPVSIQPSPSPSSSTPNSQFDSPLVFSPPQQTPTPTPNTSITSPLPIVTSPSSKDDLNFSSEEYLTILRHQKQENSERTLISPPSAPETGECPPRPPKRQKGRRGAGIGDGDEYALPPRPPKPAHLRKPRNARERSQSADPLSRLLLVPADHLDKPTDRPTVERGTRPAVGGGGGGPLRSASSNEIFKLYQTRDCLGRVVCEW